MWTSRRERRAMFVLSGLLLYAPDQPPACHMISHQEQDKVFLVPTFWLQIFNTPIQCLWIALEDCMKIRLMKKEYYILCNRQRQTDSLSSWRGQQNEWTFVYVFQKQGFLQPWFLTSNDFLFATRSPGSKTTLDTAWFIENIDQRKAGSSFQQWFANCFLERRGMTDEPMIIISVQIKHPFWLEEGNL